MEQALAPHPRTDRILSETLRAAGIVGAGGAGFPTYVKYGKPTPLLVVNGAESEPGYVCDKLLFSERAAEFARLFVFLKDVEAYDRIIVGVEEGARAHMGPLETLAGQTDAFEVAYFPNLYKYGQEKALIKVLLDREVAKAEKPPDVGVTVNNNETLWNVYRAIFEGHPVTTKFVTIYGETPAHLAVETPVGAFATDLLALAGHAAPDPRFHLFDGGPVLCDEIEDWTRKPYGVKKTTNGLLLVAPERMKTRAKSYPRAEGPPLPEAIENVERSIRRVELDLGGRFGAAATPVVDVGARVAAGDLVAEPPPDKLGVPVHASISGVVRQVDVDRVTIEAEGARS